MSANTDINLTGPPEELACGRLYIAQVRARIASAVSSGERWVSYWDRDVLEDSPKGFFGRPRLPAQCTSRGILRGVARLLEHEDSRGVEFKSDYFPPTKTAPGHYIDHIVVEWPRV